MALVFKALDFISFNPGKNISKFDRESYPKILSLVLLNKNILISMSPRICDLVHLKYFAKSSQRKSMETEIFMEICISVYSFAYTRTMFLDDIVFSKNLLKKFDYSRLIPQKCHMLSEYYSKIGLDLCTTLYINFPEEDNNKGRKKFIFKERKSTFINGFLHKYDLVFNGKFDTLVIQSHSKDATYDFSKSYVYNMYIWNMYIPLPGIIDDDLGKLTKYCLHTLSFYVKVRDKKIILPELNPELLYLDLKISSGSEDPDHNDESVKIIFVEIPLKLIKINITSDRCPEYFNFKWTCTSNGINIKNLKVIEPGRKLY